MGPPSSLLPALGELSGSCESSEDERLLRYGLQEGDEVTHISFFHWPATDRQVAQAD